MRYNCNLQQKYPLNTIPVTATAKQASIDWPIIPTKKIQWNVWPPPKQFEAKHWYKNENWITSSAWRKTCIRIVSSHTFTRCPFRRSLLAICALSSKSLGSCKVPNQSDPKAIRPTWQTETVGPGFAHRFYTWSKLATIWLQEALTVLVLNRTSFKSSRRRLSDCSDEVRLDCCSSEKMLKIQRTGSTDDSNNSSTHFTSGWRKFCSLNIDPGSKTMTVKCLHRMRSFAKNKVANMLF